MERFLMLRTCVCFTIFVSVWNIHIGFAQSTFTIPFRTGDYTPSENRSNFEELRMTWNSQVVKDRWILLVQFNQTLTKQQKQLIQAMRIELLSYLAANSYLVAIPTNSDISILSRLPIRHLGVLPSQYKISEFAATSNPTIALQITLHSLITVAEATVLLKPLGKILSDPNFPSHDHAVFLEVRSNQIETIAALPFVAVVQPAVKSSTFIDDNIATHNAFPLKHSTGLQLSGSGVTVGVGDGGTINDHLDLNSNLLNKDAIDDSSHGSLVSGIIAGKGVLDVNAKGFAPNSSIIAAYFTDILDRTNTYFNTNSMSITNNSYGNGYDISVFCDFSGNYDSNSKALDDICLQYPQVLHIIAAGNSGGVTCPTFPTSYNTVFDGIQTSKNALTVGAVSADDVIASYSSRGPVTDGRLKPEIVGVGSNVYGLNTTQGYSSGSGTSFSCPTLSGIAALLTEHYKNLNASQLPSAALLKAILCNTADDLGSIGPDFIYGFGRANALKASQIISDGNYLTAVVAQMDTNTHILTVPFNTEQLKIMLYWADSTALPLMNATLINNLDIEVVDANSITHYPWLLNTIPAQVNAPATTGNAFQRDSVNNIEQITINQPIPGNYEIKILGTDIPLGPQGYVVVYSFVTKSLQLTYPLGGEQFTPNEVVTITWTDTLGFEGQTFTLEYSTNNGANWNTIASGLTGYQYNFTMPNIVSNAMLIRLKDDSGNFSDESQPFTVMGRPNLTATSDCLGNVNLTWNAVTNALSYNVFSYQANNWAFVANTNTTAYQITGFDAGSSPCFTVHAVGTDSIVGINAIGKCVVTYDTTVSNFPYSEDFETNHGNWFTLGKNTDWVWGEPQKSVISSAASGTKAWITQATGNYSDAQLSYLYSPCFNLSAVTTPVLAFALAFDIEDNEQTPSSVYDYLQVQYSTNGSSWTTLGAVNQGYNWYNNAGGVAVWDATKSNWHTARYNIPVKTNRVQFRFLFNSDAYTHQEGVAIDQILLYNKSSSDYYVWIKAKAALQGSYVTDSLLMADRQRLLNVLPMEEPFTAQGYNHIGGGGETLNPSLLEIQGNNAIVDWVLLELRSKSNPQTVLVSKSLLLQRDGDLMAATGEFPVQIPGFEANDYFVTIRHRNHLSVMTANAIPLTFWLPNEY